MNESLEFRNAILDSDSLAFGCSHTWGVGVEYHEAWPYLLGAKNFGLGSASSDQVVRIARDLIPQHCPTIVYCLWPDWSRFEYQKNGVFYQSLPTDNDRIYFMDTHNDDWCRNNFANNLIQLKEICEQTHCRLIDMTLYDLIPYIDHADRWPLSKLGHHYSPTWYQWVAGIFADARDHDKKFPLAYE